MMAADRAPASKATERKRIVQVSDTQVSRKRAYFIDNWDVFVDAAATLDPIVQLAAALPINDRTIPQGWTQHDCR